MATFPLVGGVPLAPPGGPIGRPIVPPVVPGAPQLPFPADPGTITGWLLDSTANQTPHELAIELKQKLG